MERRFEEIHANTPTTSTTTTTSTASHGFSPDTFRFGAGSSGGGSGNGNNGNGIGGVAGAASAATATPSSIFSPNNTTTTTTTTTPSSTTTPTTTTNTNTTTATTIPRHTTFTFHTHRQNHNSSKLPTFRFADLHKETSIFRPSLLQHELRLQDYNHNRTPPSPVSPGPDQHPETQPNAALEISPPATKHRTTADSVSLNHADDHHFGSGEFTFRFQIPSSPAPVSSPSPAPAPAPVPSLVTAPATLSAAAATVRRTASLDTWSSARRVTDSRPDTAATLRSPSDSSDITVAARSHQRRAAISLDTSTRHYASDDPDAFRDEPQGQRELLLPKTLHRTLSDDRRNSLLRRPPISYKPPSANPQVSGATTSVPPIRSFRSSIHRRNSLFDMNLRSARPYDATEDFNDSHHRDRTLRALEGRRGDDASQITPPDSAVDRPDGDDSGDVFLKIAREDSSRRVPDRESQSVVSRLARSTRRPLSVTISSSQPKSPPQVSRRMSDQQDRSRSRGVSNEQSGERIARALAYKGPSREKSIDDVKSKIATPMRSSMLTPRSLAFQEPLSEPGPSYNQKRKASVDANTTVPSRKSSLKQTSTNFSQPRTFNSSPLVPRAAEPHRHDAPNGETNHGVEGTDSTASTAAPSTVWDELDELKSRIHRLELTGKLPPTSGAAISRASDERPPTAHTNATTLSASPKRGPGGIVQSIEVPSSQKESHPLLHSALAKSKEFLSSAVFEALETAANDALALSSMMGTAGQPGPISSGASSIGGVGGSTTVTDRQLRRKADSICRSLTELCLALSEGVVQNKPQQSPTSPRLDPLVTSPTITKFSGIANSRRPSAVPERIVTLNSSPRTTSRPEDRRNSVMASNALPSPRFNAHPISPTETPTNGRKTSLLLSRARRAGTEEPEDARSKSTMLLRTRRAQTEEPEDRAERKRPLITRGRRGTVDDRDDEARFRIPSRAIAEVQGVRAGNREYGSHLPPPPMPTTTTKESDPLGASALPRRRLTTATLNTRLTQPSTASTITTPTRRYFDRPVLTRETPTIASKPIDDRPQRQFSMGQTASLHRRATRESMIAAPSTATGNYR